MFQVVVGRLSKGLTGSCSALNAGGYEAGVDDAVSIVEGAFRFATAEPCKSFVSAQITAGASAQLFFALTSLVG